MKTMCFVVLILLFGIAACSDRVVEANSPEVSNPTPTWTVTYEAQASNLKFVVSLRESGVGPYVRLGEQQKLSINGTPLVASSGPSGVPVYTASINTTTLADSYRLRLELQSEEAKDFSIPMPKAVQLRTSVRELRAGQNLELKWSATPMELAEAGQSEHYALTIKFKPQGSSQWEVLEDKRQVDGEELKFTYASDLFSRLNKKGEIAITLHRVLFSVGTETLTSGTSQYDASLTIPFRK